MRAHDAEVRANPADPVPIVPIIHAYEDLLMFAVSATHEQEFGVTPEVRPGRTMGDGVITSYIHHNRKLAVLVELNCETDFLARTEDFATLARQVAEHIAGAAPLAVDRDALPRALVERKRREFEDAARASGKPEHLAEKIVEGKMTAYFRDVALMEQPWVREPKITVGHLMRQLSVRAGENIQVRRFARFHMGTA